MNNPDSHSEKPVIANTFYVSQHELREKAIRNMEQSTADVLAGLKSERAWGHRGTRVKAMGSDMSNKYFLSTLPKIPDHDITDADAPKGLDRAKFQAEVEASGNKGIGSKVIELAERELADTVDSTVDEQQVA